MNKPLLFSVIASLLFTPVIQANDEAKYKKSIDNIASQINAISRNINANKQALKSERDKLFEAEKKLSTLTKSISQTQKDIDNKQKMFTTLNEQLKQAKVNQKTNQQALSSLIEGRYKSADPDYLKRLLNQDNPYAVGRLRNYHEYFSKALQKKLQETQDQLKATALLQVEHQSVIDELQEKKEQQKGQHIALQKNKKKRAKSINVLSEKVATSSEKIEQLQKNRNRLNSLLTQIAKQKEELKKIEQEQLKKQQDGNASSTPKVVTRALVKGGFIKQKGRLNFPTQGKHIRRFGSRLAESGMTSEGLFIETKTSTTVRSIFRGRVIFSEFLKGYGLLLIIDHGDDHISLYGHNDVLYKKVGDVVETDEQVAKTGVTGGLKSAGLYFEIRQNATPVNPSTWCQ